MSKEIQSALHRLLADTYALYLKSQNYHWHVRGPNFKSLHELFEEQYTELAEAVDEIAERIITLGGQAPASFSEFNELKSINDGDSSSPSNKMLDDLVSNHNTIVGNLKSALKLADGASDDGTVDLLSGRIGWHEKVVWMLQASK